MKLPITSAGRKIKKHGSGPCNTHIHTAQHRRAAQISLRPTPRGAATYVFLVRPHAVPQGFDPLAAQNAENHHERVEEVVEIPPGTACNQILDNVQ